MTTTPPPRPGPVAGVHRLLIVAALICALVYGSWELRADHLLRGGLALVASVGIALYLRSLRGLATKLTPRAR